MNHIGKFTSKQISDCTRGMNRGNKLYEGHRMVLPEHKEKIIEQKRREYYVHEDECFVQEDEEKNLILEQAMQNQEMVEICWQEVINPMKLPPEEYAQYLHQAFDPKAIKEMKIRTEVGKIAGVVSAQTMLKCKMQSGNHLIALQDIISIRKL
ncbi:hypothetical protein BHU72_08485 [Desulfuribacillus stibiiarsenatis]|uniref:Uncharacterized protein n=1 Tax=Desulfuribacillus stibiiarsenatis TaxID=1390249 RepID=A0A1E5L377_9FIRM|nr:hypothetical protein [Desulfuribacillus stibiiarsenatis]OEH84536.1 hypothetical protein BHU72_08485 [Desulfuribacillus stibiiarsenatis]